MKLLYLLSAVPFPPSNGYKQKIFNLLNYMGHNHACDILALGSQEDMNQAAPWLDSVPNLRLLGVYPPDVIRNVRLKQIMLLFRKDYSPSWLRGKSSELEKALAHALQKYSYDLVHIDLGIMAQYCLNMGNIKKVLSLNDALSLSFFGAAKNRYAPITFRVSSLLKALVQYKYDKRLRTLADAIHFCGRYDTEWFSKHCKTSDSFYIPLGIDPQFFKIEKKHDQNNINILIIEKLWAAQHRNAVKYFLTKYWGKIFIKHPRIRLIIIGGMGMPTDFQNYVRKIQGIKLIEWVDKLEDILATTQIALFPYSVKVGMKNRVLQCMATSHAVIGTPNAFEGIPVRNREHVIIAENLERMASELETLLSIESTISQVAANARLLAMEKFSEQVIGKAWERFYDDVIKGIRQKEYYA